jgi:hypothetical protein
MGLRTRGTASGLEVALQLPTRNPAKHVVLHLPKSRPLAQPLSGVEVLTRPDQKTAWDFATVVQVYSRTAGPLWKPIPGLVALPVEPPLAPEKCMLLDLARVANTDPFAAPFGVPNPGKNLFTGMPVGRQTVAGIPFRIIDPAKNQGRGLVVLHSPSAPKDRTWPTLVEVPVGAQGKRLFFLGNVHGWAPADEGTGEWGAVAQYEILYADGQRQVVPLITGRTADEWTAAPEAEEVVAGLKGDPWHLNVLGVTLRSARIEKVIFRDLGTPAAPVLAGVTLER